MPSLLEIYEKKFKSLNVNKKPGIYTVGKAPHKPTLLLSIILLNRNNRMDLSNINTGLQLRVPTRRPHRGIGHPHHAPRVSAGLWARTPGSGLLTD